jgi:hypothetical protein
MNETERRVLDALDKAESKGVAYSTIPKSANNLVQQLETARAVQWQNSGRGRKLVILNRDAFEAFAQSKFPLGLSSPDSPIPDRSSAVRLTGNAKRAKRGSCHGVFLRSSCPGCVITSTKNHNQIPIYDLTQIAGGAALLLDDNSSWSFTGSIAIVENAEAFWQHDKVLNVDLAIYSVGRMSSRVYQWLASPLMHYCQFVHWGDYDPVGASEYLKLLKHCPNRATMHVPESLEKLLPLYGKRDLITKQKNVLHNLRKQTSNPTILRLITLWDKHQRGLEQEILLSDITS